MNINEQKAKEYFKGNELAFDVWKSKYALKDEKDHLIDISPKDMHKRMAREFARVEKDFIFEESKSTSNKKILSEYGQIRQPLIEERIFNYFDNFKYIVPQGSVMAQLGLNKKASLSNCVVVDSPYDSYGGIMQTDEQLVQLMKRRCGVGVNISKLRPKNTLVTNAALTSSGAISFMERFSHSTMEVSQNGRRGALMICIDVNHPDILDFVKIKQDLSKVTGANISIQLNDKFMKAVEQDSDYLLRFPCNSSDEEIKRLLHNSGEHSTIEDVPYNKTLYISSDIQVKKIKAKELWEEIIKSAHKCAEPGLMFWDTMVDYSPDGVYSEYKQEATNPCFRGDMEILTSEGYKEFKELSGTECELVNRYGEIVNGTVWCSGEKPIVEVTTWSPNIGKLYCTEDHQFMTTDKESVPAKELVGKRLMPFYNLNEEINEFVNLGFIQGKGGIGKLKHTSSSIELYIEKEDKGVGGIFGVGVGTHCIKGYNLTLKTLGFSTEPLQYRVLPSTINNWDEQDKLMFIKGLFSANGYVIKNNSIVLKSACKTLIEQLQELLEIINVDSYIIINKESYDLNISNFASILNFATQVGFIQTYKQKELKKLLLSKSPKVRSVKEIEKDKVYDFRLEGRTHWGVVEGVIAHNCSEIAMQGGDTCRLIAINLFSFVKKPFTTQSYFDYEDFYKVVYEAQRLSDDLVSLEIEHIGRIIKKVENDPEPDSTKLTELNLWKKIKSTAESSRRTGLGFTALADTIAGLNMKYGSKESLSEVEQIMRTKFKGEWDCSIDLGILRGTFKGWDADKEFPKTISSEASHTRDSTNRFYQMLYKEFPNQYNRLIKYGRRNISMSTVAPTGTLSILTQTTSGIEPLFLPFHKRRKRAIEGDRVDFIDDLGEKWMEYVVIHPKLDEWLLANISIYEKVLLDLKFINKSTEETFKEFSLSDSIQTFTSTLSDEEQLKVMEEVFKYTPWYDCTSNDINWEDRIEMQSVIQKYTTHSISSTVNLPSDVSLEKVSGIYMEAWKKNLKGITVYRDGSRAGVLVSLDNRGNAEEFKPKESFQRPKEVKADVHYMTADKQKYTVLVGKVNNFPYEIFAFPFDKNLPKGKIVKVKKRVYQYVDLKGNIIIENIPNLMEDNNEIITLLTSHALRNGEGAQYLVKTFNKSSGNMLRFYRGIGRVLKNYIDEATTTGELCNKCDVKLVFEEGCVKCPNCGESKCG